MFAIDDPTAAEALPAPEAAGTPGYFTEGDPATPVPPTLLRASFMNMVMMELLNFIGAAAIAPSKTAYDQVLNAFKALTQKGAYNYAADTGAVNTVVAALSPAPGGLTDGLIVRVKMGHTNTGAVTLNLNGLGAEPVTSNQVALGAGSLTVGSVYEFIWNSALPAWEMQTPLASAGASSVIADPGYKIYPDGYIEQWGSYPGPITTEGSVAVVFPIPFPNACFGTVTMTRNTTASVAGSTTFQEVSRSTTGATFQAQDQGTTFSDAVGGFGYRAYGR